MAFPAAGRGTTQYGTTAETDACMIECLRAPTAGFPFYPQSDNFGKLGDE